MKMYGIELTVDTQRPGNTTYEPYDYTESKEFKIFSEKVLDCISRQWRSTRELKMAFFKKHAEYQNRISWFQDALDHLYAERQIQKMRAYIDRYKK